IGRKWGDVASVRAGRIIFTRMPHWTPRDRPGSWSCRVDSVKILCGHGVSAARARAAQAEGGTGGGHRAARPDALGSAGSLLDGDPLRLLLGRLGPGHADGQDALVVGRLDVVHLDVGGKGEGAGEGAVAELRPAPLLLLLAALAVDAQNAVRNGDVDVLVGVDAGQFGPDDVVAVLDVVLDAHRVLLAVAQKAERRGERRGERRFEPIEQIRQDATRLTTLQCAHGCLLCSCTSGRPARGTGGPHVPLPRFRAPTLILPPAAHSLHGRRSFSTGT